MKGRYMKQVSKEVGTYLLALIAMVVGFLLALTVFALAAGAAENTQTVDISHELVTTEDGTRPAHKIEGRTGLLGPIRTDIVGSFLNIQIRGGEPFSVDVSDVTITQAIVSLNGNVELVRETQAVFSAQAQDDVCPEDGKVESQVDGDLDNIVLDAGTLVCIKGSGKLTEVTADGTSTLKELLDSRNKNGVLQSVSHYTVLETPSSTTTTTLIEETTTTIAEETTTTEGSTTTTESSTTTEPTVSLKETTTTTVPETTTTVAETTTTSGATTTTTFPETPEELPFTGVNLGLLALAALVFIGGGWALVTTVRRFNA